MTAPSSSASADGLSSQAAQVIATNLARFQQLFLEAGSASSAEGLFHVLVNRTGLLVGYDRAILVDLRASVPRAIRVSGNLPIDRGSPLHEQVRTLLATMTDPRQVQVLADEQRESSQLVMRCWVPVVIDRRVVVGLLLERTEPIWESGQLKQLEALAGAYAIAWRAVIGRPGRWQLWRPGRWLVGLLLVVLLVSAWVIPVPLRSVAECRVVAADPVVVTAPLDGVIDRLLVTPGQRVSRGQPLAMYQKQVIEQSCEAARQQLAEVTSSLERARVQAFDDPQAKARIRILENRVRQEQARLNIARYRLDHATITAPCAGLVVVDSPEQWTGRPVMVGGRILQLIDPVRTRVQIHVPAGDMIAFAEDQPVQVVLKADPATSYPAELMYLDRHGSLDPAGVYGFNAMAAWTRTPAPLPHIGQTGTAVL